MSETDFARRYEAILPRVQMPGQYVGGEWNAVRKDPATVRARVALAFPDAYAVGMSHHGYRILYELLNGLDGVAAERVFTPLPDMEGELRGAGLPLVTLESFTPLSAFDFVGFSLQYELAADNIFTMLSLGGIPLRAEERGPQDPLVLAGGAGAFNPEPLAEGIDLALVGEAEDALPELIGRWRELDRGAMDREALLAELVAACPGWYAPGLYEASGTTPRPRTAAAPARIERRAVADLDAAPHPRAPVVPVVETAHERVTVEIMRGCPNGCRFCQAGMITRPRRHRTVETIVQIAEACYASTGYDEIGLLSLSTSDHPDFARLVSELDRAFAERNVSLSLPSLRVDAALRGIPEQVKSVRKGGFTIAPEAGTERLRRVINKRVTDADLLDGAAAAFKAGWRSVKLYFMVGLPTETDEDVAAIAELANRVGALRGKKGRGAAVTLSAANFVPKPWTPLQWHGMVPAAELERRHAIIAGAVDRKRVRFHAHDVRVSILEGALARGGRELGPVLRGAWERGARLTAWSEEFNPDAWAGAFAAAGLDPEEMACRDLPLDAPLPWDHLDGGVDKPFLLRERAQALEEAFTDPCGAGRCAACGLTGCGLRTET
jgi:radical SAM family uncharacterized protein